MREIRTRWRQDFRFRWALANAIGFAAGGAAAGGIARAGGQPFYGVVTSGVEGARILALSSAVAFVAWGAAIGILQWWVLRRELARAVRWAPATIVGSAIGGAIAGGLGGAFGGAVTDVGADFGPTGFALAAIAGALSIGVLPGVSQWWFVLRHQVDQASRWVVSSFACFAVAVVLTAPVMLIAANLLGLGLPSAGAWGIAGVMMGTLFGATSGATLERLLRQPSVGQEPVAAA